MNDDIEASGAKILTIGPRGQPAAALAAKQMGVPNLVLADPTREVYRAYAFTKSFWVIQQSGAAVVDKAGVLQLIHRSTNPQNSLPEAEVLEAIRRIGG